MVLSLWCVVPARGTRSLTSDGSLLYITPVLFCATSRRQNTFNAVRRFISLDKSRARGPIQKIYTGRECVQSDGLVEEERLADVFDFGNGAFQVECLGQDNLENLRLVSTAAACYVPCGLAYLLHIDAMAGAGEDEGSPHGLGKPPCLRGRG